MAQKPVHHGNSPTSSDNSDDKSRTPQKGVFPVSLEEKLDLFADLILDKIEKDRKDGTLKF
ncbi:MAG: hypothetical protein COY81_02960 [Candidatus Pacebacteria bacterium CG_4_10_14_0_8_um_filter_43_12]|nr:MAG: hypothetical protein COY81_02960 [Candidatus Pacebacteria bacterium CG_4_10_14_0_8_um_filter_43_12]